MNHKYPILRPAIAMIELIFAIVIIGITLLSAPLILNQSIQSSNVAMQQESIAAASTQISLILTHNWDENASTAARGYGILNVSPSGANELNATNRGIDAVFSTRIFNTNVGFTNATLSANLGMDAGDFNSSNDIDDFTNSSKTLTIYAGENASLLKNLGEYLDTRIVMTNTIRYARNVVPNYLANTVRLNNPFQAVNASTNIKLINVRLTTGSIEDEHAKTIVLGAFSCNIGVPNATAPLNYRPLAP